ncbi:recombinase family protein [Nocardia sp. CA-151230]|uniref:recombinase family protein n=1 Tax=Nocardia sp. CA-151230 TaxID=3239982 RepID=UPI003D939BB3
MAAARDWSICEIYTEKPVSAFAKAEKRPAYDRMVEDYRVGRFNALITWDLDRLTRRPRRLEDRIDAAEVEGLRRARPCATAAHPSACAAHALVSERYP